MARPGVPCRGDVFPPFSEDLGPLVRSREGRAYQAIPAQSKLEKPLATRGRPRTSLAQRLRHARPAQARAIAWADDVALRARWLRQDVLAVSGLSYDAGTATGWSCSAARASRGLNTPTPGTQGRTRPPSGGAAQSP